MWNKKCDAVFQLLLLIARLIIRQDVEFDEFLKDWKSWPPTMSVGNPAAKRQLPFGSRSIIHMVKRSIENK